MKVGIFIARANPPHIGHISIIDKAILENKVLIVFLGSNGKIDEKNPLNFPQRKNLFLKKYKKKNNLFFIKLSDNKSDKIWTKNIYSKIKNILLKKINYNIARNNISLNFYHGDFENDSAYKTLLENKNIFSFKKNFIEVNRNKLKILFKRKSYKISGEDLRKNIKEEKYDLAEKFCDKAMWEKIKTLLISGN